MESPSEYAGTVPSREQPGAVAAKNSTKPQMNPRLQTSQNTADGHKMMKYITKDE